MPWKVRAGALALLVVVFGAGAVAGVAGYRWLSLDAQGAAMPHPPGELAARLRPLDLSREQQNQVRAVFENHRPKLDAVLRETFPKVRAVQEQIDADIAKLLTAEQRRKFEESAKRHGPPRMGPPGGGEGMRPPGPMPFDERGPMPPFGAPGVDPRAPDIASAAPAVPAAVPGAE